jgi:DNA gyrase subunit A
MTVVVKDEMVAAAKRFGDDRKTKVMKGAAGVINVEDLVADEEQVLVLTAGGYLKRTNPEEFRRQKRGGVGVIDLNTKEEDFVTTFLTTSTHSDLLFFSDLGKAYQIKMYDVPEGKRSTKGKAIVNFLSITDAEKISSVLPMRKIEKEGEKFLYMITKQGIAKKVDAASFHDVRRSGLIAIKLQKGDELIAALLVEKGDEIFLSSAKGQSIRFKESDIRPMGRAAGGVKAMKLGSGDVIVGADVIRKGAKNVEVLVVSKNGYGKATGIDEYKVQGRGGSGIKTMAITAKTGPLITSRLITRAEGGEEEIVVISKKGQVIRTGLDEIKTQSRSTQGVRIMKLRDADAIASFVCL